MIYGVVLFAVISLIFSLPGLRWMAAGELELSPREEKIGFLFGHYMGAAAALMFFLWLLKPMGLPHLYAGAGGLYLVLTLCFLYQTVRIFKKEETGS
ncbi:hypothetical protein AALB39_22300 [Lachnospiraceae bacterium 54-53]